MGTDKLKAINNIDSVIIYDGISPTEMKQKRKTKMRLREMSKNSKRS